MTERPSHNYNGEMMRKGRENELAVVRWLESRGNKVIDATEHGFMQGHDVDVVVNTPKDQTLLMEIKADHDADTTGNICFEVMRIYHKNGRFQYGWAIKTPADYLLYALPNTGEILMFKMPELKKRCAEYVHKSGKSLKARTIETDTDTTTHVFLIPISELDGTYTKERM